MKIDDGIKYSFVVTNFDELETRLKECLEFIPFIDNNYGVISPKFITIILDSCSLIESLFIEYLNANDKKYTFKDYARLVEPELELGETISIFLNSPIKFISPYKNWQNTIPEWWNTYNKLKHDRLSNYQLATYESTINSITALHQLISKIYDLIPALITAGWFNSDGGDIGELIAARIAQAGVPMNIIPVSSKLFVSPLHSNFVEFKNGIPNIENCDFPNRVRDIITLYEWFD